jgi:hypothetical protein
MVQGHVTEGDISLNHPRMYRDTTDWYWIPHGYCDFLIYTFNIASRLAIGEPWFWFYFVTPWSPRPSPSIRLRVGASISVHRAIAPLYPTLLFLFLSILITLQILIYFLVYSYTSLTLSYLYNSLSLFNILSCNLY